MTHRERFLTAIHGGTPDFVPTFELVFHETERDFGGRVFYGTPFAPVPSDVPRRRVLEHNARLYLDVARRFEHSAILIAPLQWPFVDHYDQVVWMLNMLRDLAGDELCLLSPGDPTFKIPADPMKFAERIYDDPKGLKRQAQAQVGAMLPAYDAVMQAGADGVVLTSDYAFNSGPFLSPSQFSEFVTPYLAQAVAAIRQRGGVAIKHSDGNLMPVLDQIIQAGPHALHSIDPMAGMDIKLIKARYGHSVCLCGNVHCAWLQTGTTEQIRFSAEYCLTHAKPGGGYVFSTSNCVFRGMPLSSYDLIHGIWRRMRYY